MPADRIWLAAALLGLPLALTAGEAPQGKRIFTEVAAPPCAVCHTLADAGASGEVGPSLDALKPSAERVRKAVREGLNAMPSYEDTLSDAQIEAVARYVAGAAGG